MSLLLGALLGGVGSSLIGGLFQSSANTQNVGMQRETNQMQMDMFNRQFDYTKQTQQEAWRRDDNALQRSVKDAHLAGLSPLAALGGGANASIASAPSAPHLQAPQVDPLLSGFNLDSAIDAAIQSRRLDIEERKVLNEKEKADADRQSKMDIVNMELSQANEINLRMMSQSENQFSKKLAQELYSVNKNLEYLNSAQDWKEKKEYQETVIKEINSLMDEARGRTGGQSSAYRVYENESAYNAAYTAWVNRYKDFLKVEFSDPSKKSRMESKNVSSGAGANVAGSGVSGAAGANFNMATGDMTSMSTDYTEQDKQKLSNWFAANPVPIYRPGFRKY